jgi:hypothetical protein
VCTESMASRTRGEAMMPARNRLPTSSALEAPLQDQAMVEKRRLGRRAVLDGVQWAPCQCLLFRDILRSGENRRPVWWGEESRTSVVASDTDQRGQIAMM